MMMVEKSGAYDVEGWWEVRCAHYIAGAQLAGKVRRTAGEHTGDDDDPGAGHRHRRQIINRSFVEQMNQGRNLPFAVEFKNSTDASIR
jgi:hypothetical protein